MNQGSEPNQVSLIREWMENNKTATNIMAVWLLFVVEMVVAKLFGDFARPPFYLRKFMEDRTTFILIIAAPPGLLSLINVYVVPAFAQWFNADKRKPVIRLAIFGGLFGSLFCCPVLGVSLGLGFALFLAVTLIHMFGRVMPKGGSAGCL